MGSPCLSPRLSPTTGFVEVGRSPECGVAIAGDLSVSLKHCQLAVLVSRCFVRDLGSEFGTFVNEEKLAKDHELKDGDAVRVGSGTVLRLEATVEGGIENASSDDDDDDSLEP